MLDCVRASLIERVAGLDVGIDLVVRIIPHGNVRNAEFLQEESIAQAKQGNPGVDLMRVSAQARQHCDRFRHILRLAQNIITIHNCGIRREDDLVRVSRDGARFCFCKS